MIDLPPPPQLWMPARPAIIRPGELVAPSALAMLVAPPFMKPSAAAGVTVTYIGFSVSYTPSFSIPADGTMVVTVGARALAAREVTSIVIDGAESLQVTKTGAVATSGLGSRNVAAGSRAVSISYSGAVSYEGVHCWLVTGLASATAHDTDADNGGNTNTMTLDIPAGGVAIYHGMIRTGTTAEWSSATEEAESTGNNSSTHSAAYKQTASLLTGHAETVTYGSAVNSAGCGASFSAA